MAGKFLSLEEAARRLGVSVDEVNRLVDRKELFPLRAGATIKFKVDDIERVAADLGGGGPGSGGDLDLDLDLDLSASGAGDSLAAAPSAPGSDDLILGEPEDAESIFGGDGGEPAVTGSQTIVREGEGGAPTDGGAFEDDLALDSIIGASSPSLPAVGQPETSGIDAPPADSGTMAIDLSNLGGSVAGLSSPSGMGDSLAGPIDSGLSLEGDGIDISGIDLAAGDAVEASGVDDLEGGSLAGDAFELGAGVDDEESASVVIATEETGDSSFFATVEDAPSVSYDDASGSVDIPLHDFDPADLVPSSPPFSIWQVVGLICCTLLMLGGGLVVFDVLAVVQSPDRNPLSTPLLTALAQTFGW